MYSLKLTNIAAEFIKKLDKKSQSQIIEKIELLKENPLEIGRASCRERVYHPV